MRSIVLYIPLTLWMASCSSPPKPPTVDGSQRRPVNVQTEVELQSCKSDLQNLRIVAGENSDAAARTGEFMARLQAQQRATAAACAARATPAGNTVYNVQFTFGNAKMVLPESPVLQKMIDDAKAAPLVMLRGRTDGFRETPAESRMAGDRATAVRAYLVAMGVDPGRIRWTYQPIGDHIADNATASGRDANRRVEVEVYRVAPTTVTLPTHAPRAS